MENYIDILGGRAQKIIEEGTPDRRKNRVGRSYFLVVKGSFEFINNLLAQGDTILGIFENLRKSGIFNETADYHAFYMAFQREGKRRGLDIRRNVRNKGTIKKESSITRVTREQGLPKGSDGNNDGFKNRNREDDI